MPLHHLNTTVIPSAVEGPAVAFTPAVIPSKATAEGERTGCCFAAGTPVHTNHGDVPVEKVEVGDEVLARNSKTGKLENEPVTALTTPHQDHMVDLRIEGERDPLRPSDDHPFWVRRGGDPAGAWMEAGKLKLGDLLETTHGTWRRITAITPESHEQTVYNFTVAKDHDYFVGETGFLVHNAPPCGCNYTDPYIRKWVRDELEEAQEYTEDGLRIDPNSGVPYAGPPDIGHRPGFELWKMKALAGQNGLTQQEFNEMMQDPEFYQLENPETNRSHCFELP